MNKEVGFQKEKLLRKRSFSADELAEIKLPGFPGTPRALRDLAKAGDWPSIAVRSRGKGGLKYEYEPPSALLEVIRRHLQGEVVTEAEVIAARSQRAQSQMQRQGDLDELGVRLTHVAALHDIGKRHPAFERALDESEGLLRPRGSGAGKTLENIGVIMTMLRAEALSAGFKRVIFLQGAGQAELLILGNRTVAHLAEESVRRQLALDDLVNDAEVLDAALRLEWLLMQRETKTADADQT